MKKGHKYSEYERITHHLKIAHKRPSSYTVRRIKIKLGGTCACGESNPSCIDLHHIVPLYLGGTNDINNFECVCVNCHRKQHASLRA